MRNILRPLLASAAIGALVPVAQAQDTRVTIQGFCVVKTQMKCEEVALPGSTISYSVLPKLPDGKRVIYFYSDQRSDANTVLMHVLEAEDFDEGTQLDVPKALERQSATLKPAMEAVAKKLGKGGLVAVAPFEATAGAKPMRSFSSIVVEGPGAFSGQVVDQNGTPVPGSDRVSFLVTRGPVTDSPGSGLSSIDADG